MNELVKPSLQVDLDIKMPKIEPISHNLNVIEDYAIKLKDFYDKLVFDESQYKQAKDERAKVNGLIKKIADNRKEIIKQYKEPISDFEETSKRIEKLLGDSSSIIDSSIKKFDLKQQEIKTERINEIIEQAREEYIRDFPEYENAFRQFVVEFDNRWFNKTYKDSDLGNDITNQFEEKLADLNRFKKDAATIVEYFNAIDTEHLLNKEVYIERYKYTRDVNEVLESIKKDLEVKKLNTAEKSVEKPAENTVEMQTDPFAGLSVNNDSIPKEIVIKLTLPKDKLALVEKFAKENNIKMEEM